MMISPNKNIEKLFKYFKHMLVEDHSCDVNYFNYNFKKFMC